MLDFEQIKQSLSQRFPYIMVDRIVDIEEGRRVIGIKNITGNEICFLGHFPDRAIFPGTLLIEVMAQVSTFLFYRETAKNEKLDFYLGAVKDARFYKPVQPGDQLRVEAQSLRITDDSAYVKIISFVENEKVAEGELIFVRRNK